MVSPSVERIKERVSIVDVVSSYVKLEKAGRNFKGLSPFNKERTPSFFVSPEKGVFHCFSSGKGGDVFTFVEEMEGVDFKGALKILAERAGIPLEFESGEERNARARLYTILEEATRFFENNFSKYKDAHNYLASRGLVGATMTKWRLGWAPQSWHALKDHLESKKFTLQEMEEGGLIKSEEGKNPIDRFRSRIMFPLADAGGRIVAFSGRYVKEQGAKDPEHEPPKYLNSPETPLFSKSKILYGYDKAKGFIRKYNFSILVEGQMDLVMSHQAGFPNSVAVSGTALTNDHLTLLGRISRNVLMAFDADPAGIASAGKGARLALTLGMDVKAVVMPLGIDPADLIKEDKEKWRLAIRGAKHIIEFYLDILGQKYEGRKLSQHVRESVLPFVALVKSAIDRAHFVALVARRLSIREEAVWDELNKMPVNATVESSEGGIESLETKVTRSRLETLKRLLIGLVFLGQSERSPSFDVEALAMVLRALTPHEGNALLSAPESIRKELLFEAELMFGEGKVVDKSKIVELLRDLEFFVLEEEREKIKNTHRRLEEAGDNEAHVLFKKYKDISERMNALSRKTYAL